MSGGKSIVRAFVRIRETAETAELTVAGESVSAPCKYFVAVGLMADVPDYAVVGSVENIM